jgi:hypothetical protein
MTTQRMSPTKVADGEKSSEKLNQSLEKVRCTAALRAGELADLRLKNQEFDVSLKQLKQNQSLAPRRRSSRRRGGSPQRSLSDRRRPAPIREGAPGQGRPRRARGQVQSPSAEC